MSKFLPGTVEENSSTIRSSGRNRTYAYANLRLIAYAGSIPAGGPFVDEFFSIIPGKNFRMCIISTRTKTH